MQERKGSEGNGGHGAAQGPAGAGLQQGRAVAPWCPPARLWPWSQSLKVAPAWKQRGLCTDRGVPWGVLQRGRLTAGGVGDGGWETGVVKAQAGRRQGPHVPAACGRPEIAAAAERASFPLNGKSGRNLGPFQSPLSRALAAIRRQERHGAGGGSVPGLGCAPLPQHRAAASWGSHPTPGSPPCRKQGHVPTTPPTCRHQKTHLMGLW